MPKSVPAVWMMLLALVISAGVGVAADLVADAGPDQIVEQASADGTAVTLDGSNSSGGGLGQPAVWEDYRAFDDVQDGFNWWTHATDYPRPALSATLTLAIYRANMNTVAFVDADGIWQMLDYVPPAPGTTVVTYELDPAWLGSNEVFVDLSFGAYVAWSTLRVEYEGAAGELTYEWREGDTLLGNTAVITPVLQLGAHTVTLTVSDGVGTATDETVVTVADTAAPAASLTVLKNTLWPANHEMVLAARVSGAQDVCDAAPEVSVRVTSNEDINGAGDGNTASDWALVRNGDGWDIYLRAERAGGSDGRFYSIEATVTDGSGNNTTYSGEVQVPHDQGKGKKNGR